jgi:hypothetical protein
MNERLKEIERQCWQSTETKPYALFDVKKFAELIVRECIDVVGKATASPNGYQALMKHFGVEE